jgi:hypothetical protein
MEQMVERLLAEMKAIQGKMEVKREEMKIIQVEMKAVSETSKEES